MSIYIYICIYTYVHIYIHTYLSRVSSPGLVFVLEAAGDYALPEVVHASCRDPKGPRVNFRVTLTPG